MAALVQDIERPAFLDRAIDGQLAFGAATSVRERRATPGVTQVRLSERLLAERSAGQVRPDTARGGGATLDELLVGAWEGLSARRPVACPVCAGPMNVRAHGGACAECGSELR